MQGRTHTCGELRIGDAGKTVTLVGWFENIRKVSKNLGFVVLRDLRFELFQSPLYILKRYVHQIRGVLHLLDFFGRKPGLLCKGIQIVGGGHSLIGKPAQSRKSAGGGRRNGLELLSGICCRPMDAHPKMRLAPRAIDPRDRYLCKSRDTYAQIQGLHQER